MTLLDLDPNVIKPGWTPLLITVGLALVMVLLFRSMRRQFRRVDANFPEPAAAARTVSILPEAAQTAGHETSEPTEKPTGGGNFPAR
jgi:hypothetical protein